MAKRERLTREKIIEAAMAMLDREGEKGFSMRKLAAELGVDPMALYHHHSSRRTLIHEVLRAYRGWKSLGWAAKWVTMILASLAGALMAWKTVAEEIRKWLTG